MIDLSHLLAADCVDAGVTAANKKALFQQLAIPMARATGLAAKEIVACLNERERLGSTGFGGGIARSEEHTSELQSLMRISYAVFCLKKKKKKHQATNY